MKVTISFYTCAPHSEYIMISIKKKYAIGSEVFLLVVLVFVVQFLVSVQTVLLEQSVLCARKLYDKIKCSPVQIGNAVPAGSGYFFVESISEAHIKVRFFEGSNLDSVLV